MSDITHAQLHQLRYGTPTLANQIEVAVMHEAKLILSFDNSKAPPVPPPTQTDEERWAVWANDNSSRASDVFKWPCALDDAIQQQALSALNGSVIGDADVQRVVHNALPQVIVDWASTNPALLSEALPKDEKTDEQHDEQQEPDQQTTAKKHRRGHAS